MNLKLLMGNLGILIKFVMKRKYKRRKNKL
jgi:hypothetical protein